MFQCLAQYINEMGKNNKIENPYSRCWLPKATTKLKTDPITNNISPIEPVNKVIITRKFAIVLITQFLV